MCHRCIKNCKFNKTLLKIHQIFATNKSRHTIARSAQYFKSGSCRYSLTVATPRITVAQAMNDICTDASSELSIITFLMLLLILKALNKPIHASSLTRVQSTDEDKLSTQYSNILQ